MIEFTAVEKTYRSVLGRSVLAVEDFSLAVHDGEVLGIAGPNGAGKSTLVALLLGFLQPSAGAVTIGGEPPRAYVERHGIGYLPELVDVNPRWTVAGALHRFALLAGIAEAEVPLRCQEVIERLGLDEHRDKQFRQLSKGNKQRLGLAQALLADDDVIVLDEPTHGLDPLWTMRFREIVAGLRRRGRAILIASHNLEELERLCDRVAIIDRGRLQRVVEVGRLLPMTQAVIYRLTVAGGVEHLARVFPDAVDLGRGDWAVRADTLPELNARLGELLALGTLLAGVAPAQSALEQQFQDAIGEMSL